MRCDEFWNPDVFGYNGQLPQIMREGGVERFLTQKLSWNRFNRPEHHTFVWQGIDGSEVLAHFPPADTYTSEGTVAELRKSARAYKDHEHSRTSMLVYGFGDGGGGPTREMIETMLRARDLQGLPRTTMRAPAEFFAALEAEPGERPTILGELYFEYHRGTYTTQARTKRGNRRAEIALHDAEFLATAAGGDYPRAELDRLWKLLLLQQFHDILPGSSIRLVYEDAERDLAEVEAGANAIADAALAALGGGPVNTTGFARREVVRAPNGDLTVVEAPPYGIGAPAADALVLKQHKVTRDGLVLENEHLRVEVGEDGSVLSVVERATGREALAAPGNRLELYDDRPVAFEAWDIDPFHLETRRDSPPATSHAVVTESPLRVEIAFERAVGEREHDAPGRPSRRGLASPRVPHRGRLARGSHPAQGLFSARRPSAERDVRDAVRLRRAADPLLDEPRPRALRGARAPLRRPLRARLRRRPPHRLQVRLQLLRQRAAAQPPPRLQEPGSGGGHGPARARVRASPPRRRVARGRCRRRGGAVQHAAAPVRAAREKVLFQHKVARTPSVDDPNLVLDTIKRAEDSDAIVLRLYEAHGARGTANVTLELPFTSARRANALEDEGDELAVNGNVIEVPFRPHEIVTVVAR